MEKWELLRSLDMFTTQYLETALWSSTDESDESGGRPLDDNYGIENLSLATLRESIADCKAFQEEHWGLIKSDLSRAGHDFWLTRNHHGAGFWDGDWEDEAGKILTDASHAYGSVDLYVGDDGEIHS